MEAFPCPRGIFWPKSFKVLLARISREANKCMRQSNFYEGKERGNGDSRNYTISSVLEIIIMIFLGNKLSYKQTKL